MTPGPTDQLTSINSQVVQYIGVLLALGGVLLLAYVLLRIGLPRLFIKHLYECVQLGIAARDLLQMCVHQFQRGDHSVPHERYHEAQTRSIRH